MHGHHDFDHAVQEANLWLGKIDDRLHLGSRGLAASALRATLHTLRDRLTPEMAVHLSAQLPLVIRGVFFEGWKLSHSPSEDDNIEQFCTHVAIQLPAAFPVDARTVVSAVFEVIWSELDPGETAKVIDFLPRALRVLWPAVARRT
jgi:uncharacterized protein (DUF2267 family)